MPEKQKEKKEKVSKIGNIFTSHYTIGKSIFTLDEIDKKNPKEIKENAPVSIFTVAKKYNLEEIYLRENDISGYLQALKNSDLAGVALRFGLKLRITDDVKDEENFKNRASAISIWLLNSKGQKDFIRLFSRMERGHLTWRILQEFFTENMSLSIPFYGSFLFKNNFKNSNCVPDFGPIKPVFELQDMGLPYDATHREIVTKYAKDAGFPTQEVHLSYYYDTARIKAYQIFRTICCRPVFEGAEKKSFNNPGLEHFCSDQFSFEKYCEKTETLFLN
jgi:hypothetical protein